jgi:hypothetical protein
MRLRYLALASLLAGALPIGCAKQMQREIVQPDRVETLDRKAPYLKVHTRGGEVYVLSPWTHRPGDTAVTGTGRLLDINRNVVARGEFSVPVDSAVLFETNVVSTSSAVAVLGVLTGVSAGVTAYCATNPKACFGSCPTFYVSDGESDLLQAEGFSASIAPSLEATDVDHLYRARPDSRWLNIRMTNEALETHVVRFVNLLAVDRGGDARVFADSHGRYWRAVSVLQPTECRGADGDCLDAVRNFDGVERTSLADSTDLAAREEVDLVFPTPVGDRLAIVIGSRQTLLPTFLLYQAYAWLGTSAGQWIATLERGDRRTTDRVASVVRTLGGIDVRVQDTSYTWRSAGEIMETGPLGSDVRLVSIPPQRDSLRVQLRMSQGAWRIDYVALAVLGDSVTPIRLQPKTVSASRRPSSDVRDILLDSNRVLATFPGDEYVLKYELPEEYARYELFLESRGYYLEWMRDEWIAEENPLRAAALFLDPGRTMRDLAPEFKRLEPTMEAAFWRSKYVRP